MAAPAAQEEINGFVGAAHGDIETVRRVADAHPDWMNARAGWDETPLGAASHVGQKEITRFLLSRGAELDICAAALLGMSPEVAAFLDRDPSLANAVGAHSIGVLFHAVIGGEPEIAALLVARGADVDAGGEGIATALQGAAMTGNVELAAWLIGQGAEVNRRGYQNQTPLATAVASEQQPVAALLRGHDASE